MNGWSEIEKKVMKQSEPKGGIEERLYRCREPSY